MIRTSIFGLFLATVLIVSPAHAWRLEMTSAPGKVTEIETVDNEVRVATNSGWFRAVVAGNGVTLQPISPPRYSPLPNGALPDGRVVAGKRDIARAWLAAPTHRYAHGALGDSVEAGALVIETRDGRTHTLTLKIGAVFEDLRPRIVDLGDGGDSVIVVKSYLKRGSALAVIGRRHGSYDVIAETPAIGAPHRWLYPAGIADFDGDGTVDIALVKLPHAVGRLELWSWRGNRLEKTAAVTKTSNHSIGSRALDKSAVADFDGDGKPDLALPSFDERSLRLIAFAPKERKAAREIARLMLPARPVTNFGLLHGADGKPVVIVGLENGKLVTVKNSSVITGRSWKRLSQSSPAPGKLPESRSSRW